MDSQKEYIVQVPVRVLLTDLTQEQIDSLLAWIGMLFSMCWCVNTLEVNRRIIADIYSLQCNQQDCRGTRSDNTSSPLNFAAGNEFCELDKAG